MKKARNRWYETDLDLEYLRDLWIRQSGLCAISGFKMILPFNSRRWEKQTKDPWKPSLDRINPKHGYTKGNVRYVSVIANIARSTFSDDQLIEFCMRVIEYQKLKMNE